ncbi:AAA family ATPase, partial [Vibrio anguillarum]
MFKRIKLTNFKAWRESGDVDLAPVTLLLGENSTGKSSLLQSLLLM